MCQGDGVAPRRSRVCVNCTRRYPLDVRSSGEFRLWHNKRAPSHEDSIKCQKIALSVEARNHSGEHVGLGSLRKDREISI